MGGVRLHLGFVAICLSERDCSPAGSMTVAAASRLDPEARRYRLREIARRNLDNTLRILFFLKAHGIRLYRISANLIPLATHPLTSGWSWWDEPDLRAVGTRIGRTARETGVRLSSHLPEVCGAGSESQFRWLQAYLDYHRRLFDLLDLDERAKIVIHVGGRGGRGRAGLPALVETAARHLDRLDEWSRSRLVLENDDRTVDLVTALDLAERFDLPVAFDWHHHVCCPPPGFPDPRSADGVAALEPLVARAFRLWRDRPPKIHLSSPRDGKNPRAHADYVDPAFIAPLLEVLARLDVGEVDAMVEAKKKDLALFRLVQDFTGGRKG
ncbi:UV DNA damage repair endonuclease UvsE [Thermaerobacter marianensis]|uniref:UV DNA damage repair endonuclease UvsE n=1 Tax=Thermaerobacter marianensis TaxID=73919 RepID=UPI00031EBAD0|nr:UV DNA damage repair endonuclease UvsE [Thermaerobacter marianensis]